MTIEDRVSTFLVEYVRVDDGKVIESCDLSIRQIEEEDWIGFIGTVSQVVREPVLYTGSRGFESLLSHHKHL